MKQALGEWYTGGGGNADTGNKGGSGIVIIRYIPPPKGTVISIR